MGEMLEGIIKLSKAVGVKESMRMYGVFENKYYAKHRHEYLESISTGNIEEYDCEKLKVRNRCLNLYLKNNKGVK